jgi:hypothetical protein
MYLGDSVSSPALSSLPILWQKIAFGIAIPNFLIAGALYSHTASKLVFVRFFRKSRHLHENTIWGWTNWTFLIIIMNGAAFVLAVGVPIFNYIVGLAASLVIIILLLTLRMNANMACSLLPGIHTV